jgi:hypothetical protein
MSFLEIGYSRISSTIYLQFGYDIIRKEDDDDEISKTAIYKAIQELPPEQKSVNDIHLIYTVPDIYTILTTSPSSTCIPKPVSMDIHLPVLNTADGLRIQTLVYRTDTEYENSNNS